MSDCIFCGNLEGTNTECERCRLIAEIADLKNKIAAFRVKEGPLNSERWTLNELLEKLEDWKRIASGQTCVSFEALCFGASSLWHQTHRENYRKIKRRPAALSLWMLGRQGHVRGDFAAQVLELLMQLDSDNNRLQEILESGVDTSLDHISPEDQKRNDAMERGDELRDRAKDEK